MKRHIRHSRKAIAATFEALEPRSLFSVAVVQTFHPHMITDGFSLAPGSQSSSNPLDQPAVVATLSGVNYAYRSYAVVRWSTGAVATAGFSPAANGRLNVVIGALAGLHGTLSFTVGFWQLTPTNQVVNATGFAGFVYQDTTSTRGSAFSVFSGSTFTAKLGTLAGPYPDEVAGKQTPYTVAGATPSDGGRTYTLSIYWGDHTAASFGVLRKSAGGTWEAWGSHAYATPGHYTVQYVVTNSPGGGGVSASFVQQSAIETSYITVVPGQSTGAASARSGVVVNTPYSHTLGHIDLSFGPSASDPDSDLATGKIRHILPGQTLGREISVTINWGDNTTPTNAVLTINSAGGWDVSGTHTYAATGSYTVTVTAAITGAYEPGQPTQSITLPPQYSGETSFSFAMLVGNPSNITVHPG